MDEDPITRRIQARAKRQPWKRTRACSHCGAGPQVRHGQYCYMAYLESMKVDQVDNPAESARWRNSCWNAYPGQQHDNHDPQGRNICRAPRRR